MESITEKDGYLDSTAKNMEIKERRQQVMSHKAKC